MIPHRKLSDVLKEASRSKKATYRMVEKATGQANSNISDYANERKTPPQNAKFYEDLAGLLEMDPYTFREYVFLKAKDKMHSDISYARRILLFDGEKMGQLVDAFAALYPDEELVEKAYGYVDELIEKLSRLVEDKGRAGKAGRKP